MIRIEERMRRRILVLDGAMGTMIQRLGLGESDFRGERYRDDTFPPLKGCNDVLNVTAPEKIMEIHRSYLEAGADIIETNTFNSNSLSMSEYHLEGDVALFNEEGARLARRSVDDYCTSHGIADKERPLVAGSIGPTGVSLSISMQSDEATCDFDRMSESIREQAEALIAGGVDLLLLETSFDTLNAKAALYGMRQAIERSGREVPVMVSMTLTEQGRLLSGQSMEQFVEAILHARPLSIGLNCGFGAGALIPWAERLGEITDRYVSIHPNAGLPDEMGCYTDTAERMRDELRPLLEGGKVNIVGGCCGTTPEHIREIAMLAGQCPPRVPGKVPGEGGGFVKVGERCNVAGSRKFLRLVKEGSWNETLEIAAGQLDKGAEILDINMDDPLLDARESMERFVRLLGSDARTASVPLMIDSSDFNVIRSALRLTPLKGIVNSISLKNGEEEFLSHALEIHHLGASMVVMAFDERGQADTYERRIEICGRAYGLLTSVGIPGTDIIFDPNILAICTGIAEHDKYAYDFLRATEWITRHLPGARVSGGVSNLSFSFRGVDPVRRAMHAVFLENAIERGMGMGIVNPSTPLTSEGVDEELAGMVRDVIFHYGAKSTGRLVEYAVELKRELDAAKGSRKGKVEEAVCASGGGKVEERAIEVLSGKVVRGDSTLLTETLDKALEETGSAMGVVNEGLMRGMDIVGERFGKGLMFLPQVVRSAAVMKRSVEYLTPRIEAEQLAGREEEESRTRPLMVLATVKGDVHDIGKNIVAIVMRCSGFDVIDMGVMTPPEEIIAKAIEKEAAVIGLSGLITPSLHEMCVVAKMMERKGLRIPLFVGGATTSDLHTAVRIAPLYEGPVVHTGDAATLPGTVRMFTSGENVDGVSAELTTRQDELRREYGQRDGYLSLSEARERAHHTETGAPEPLYKGEKEYVFTLDDLLPLINWRAFVHAWGLKPKDITEKGSEASRVIADGKRLLGRESGGLVKARVRVYPARGDGDDIVLESDSGELRLPMMRSVKPNVSTGECECQSDYLRSDGDWLGVFAVTVAGSGMSSRMESGGVEDEYESLLYQSLSHRLAEAGTELMHRRMREEVWGIPAGCGVRPAIGYPSLPDQSLVFEVDKLMRYAELGITLTGHGALYPSATTTGFIFGSEGSRYFEVRGISDESKRDYAGRRGMEVAELDRYLPR